MKKIIAIILSLIMGASITTATLRQSGVCTVKTGDVVSWYIDNPDVKVKNGKFDVVITIDVDSTSPVNELMFKNNKFNLVREDFRRWSIDGSGGTQMCNEWELHVKNCTTTNVPDIINGALK